MRRTLSLNKEVLGELTTMELQSVLGAAQTDGGICDKINTLGLDCTIPTCGRLCTGTSTTGLESLACVGTN